MNEQKLAGDDNRKVAPVYIVLERETLIDAPVKVVWQHALNYPSWQNYSIVRHVSGEPGKEGEVVFLKKDELKSPTTAYYARTIKLEPERRVVWKTYRENVNYFGIVDFRFYDLGSKTRFCNNSLYEHNVAYRDESELEEFRRQSYASMDELLSTILPKLKALAENAR
jgi:hypothetical protein